MGVHLSDDNRTIEHEESLTERTIGRRASDFLRASVTTTALALMAHVTSIELILRGAGTDADKLEQIGMEVEMVKLLDEKPLPGIRTVEVYDQAGNIRIQHKVGSRTV